MNFECLDRVPQMYDEITLEDMFVICEEYFQEMRTTCVSIGVAGTSPPPDMAAQMERIHGCLARLT